MGAHAGPRGHERHAKRREQSRRADARELTEGDWSRIAAARKRVQLSQRCAHRKSYCAGMPQQELNVTLEDEAEAFKEWFPTFGEHFGPQLFGPELWLGVELAEALLLSKAASH